MRKVEACGLQSLALHARSHFEADTMILRACIRMRLHAGFSGRVRIELPGAAWWSAPLIGMPPIAS